MSEKPVKFYSPLEEGLNIGTHALGMILAVIGLFLLLQKGFALGQGVALLAYGIYGLSMLMLFTASTCYHSAKKPAIRSRLRVLDHASIYVLIAGTYTPFMLLIMPGPLGYGILIAAWSMAIVGIIIKVFYTGHFEVASTLLYVAMGWAIVFAIKPLADQLAAPGLHWLIFGGVSYTIGAILYAIKGIPFNHAIFHVFVLLGSICHFISIYKFV